MNHNFPSLGEVIDMHSTLIETFGGMPGILDEGALDSALTRPQLGYYDDLIQEAAALMESLAVATPGQMVHGLPHRPLVGPDHHVPCHLRRMANQKPGTLL